MIQPMPALARFALGEAEVRETLEGPPRVTANDLFGSP